MININIHDITYSGKIYLIYGALRADYITVICLTYNRNYYIKRNHRLYTYD